VLADAVAKVREGDITQSHLRAIDHGTRRLPESDRADATKILTELAEVASVSEVRAVAQHLTQVIDPDGSLADHERQFERRYLTLAPMLDGMVALDGLFDVEAAALLNTALQPFLTPSDADDQRTAAQRRADGLVQIVQSAADHRLLPVAGGERPHLQVTLPRGLTCQSPGGPAQLHPRSVARIACDSQVTPLLLDEHGVVADLGRTARLFSPQQRKLLAARDGGCRWPGCDRPPAHTDAHHVVSWLDGGATDVANALLLCRHHHRSVHERGWSVAVIDRTRGSGGAVAFVGPDDQRLTSHPRAP
jgi:hypothetical protein